MGLANTDETRGYISSLQEHDQWLVQSTAVGATIFLLIIVITYLLGDAQPLKTEAMFLFVYAGLYLYAGSKMIQHYKDQNNDMGKAMGSMAIISGGVMGVTSLVHLFKFIDRFPID